MKGNVPWDNRKKFEGTVKEAMARRLRLVAAPGFAKGHVPWDRGKQLNEDTKKKISKELRGNRNKLGWKLTEEQKKAIGDRNKGAKHPLWIKDRSIVQRNKRNDPAYLQWVNKIKKRDGYSCRLKSQECSGYNIVHHILGWTKFPELRYNINNGITLCQFHHPRKRADEERLTPTLKRLVGSCEQ